VDDQVAVDGAFFGAGYLSAVVALGFAARAPSWERARIVAVEHDFESRGHGVTGDEHGR